MESYQKESMRRIRRNSKTLHQDLSYRGVTGGEQETPVPPQAGRDAKMIKSIASLIRAKSKLLLLESPDTVEIYKLQDSNVPRGKDDIYLPAINTKTSNLSSMAGALSQSCPYLYDKRRGSFSSVGSQRAGAQLKRPSHLKAQREAKKSNVTVTMTYLGQGHRGSSLLSTPDELKVLQQVNGGENIRVFKGLVTPGEQFQFVSQRHRGFPFSATLYVNSLMVARISSCCEYRYTPGFQQGRKSCFRLSWLSGGVPCHRCTSLRNKYSSCQQLNHGTKENVIVPLQPNPGKGGTESCPSSPLFIPTKPQSTSVRKTRKQIKKGDNGATESDDLPDAVIKETHEKRRRKGHKKNKDKKAARLTGDITADSKVSEVSQKSSLSEKNNDPRLSGKNEMKTNGVVGAEPTEPLNKTSRRCNSLQDEGALTKHRNEKERNGGSNERNSDGERLKDFYKECVEMSEALERSPNKHNWFKANILERCRLHKRLSCCPRPSASDVELSPESDTNPPPDEEKEEEDKASEKVAEDPPAQEHDLQAQLNALMTVLSTSDEVEQLILRNTDLTDDLLLSLAGALKSSKSEVTLLNLNLNLIGPYGAHILLDVLRVKPQVKGLHLFGNKFRDHGLLTLLSGVAELQDQTARAAAAIQQALLFPSEQNLHLHHAIINSPAGWSSLKVFALLELDIGGNKLGSEGVRVLASYMRDHSYLQYLGLAQTSEADLSAWKDFFDSIKGNRSLTQINLDENNLGDPGMRLLADALMVNMNLKQVDLDGNGISDVGGNDIMAALLSRNQFPLTHLSLQENNISPGLMCRIQEEVKQNLSIL